MNKVDDRRMYVTLLLMSLFAFVGYYTLFAEGFDNQTLNTFAPHSTDAVQYVSLAETLTEPGGFTKAFGDGYRTPMYPVILFICQYVFSKSLLAARILNLLLTAAIIPLIFASIRKVTSTNTTSFLGAALCLIWVPFYYFAPVLIAESISFFFVAVTILLLSLYQSSGKLILLIGSGIVLAILVYLKPNHILLALPVCVFAGMASRGKWRIHALIPIALMVALILPWTVFISEKNNTFIPLSTTSGMNMVLGTGISDGEFFYTGEQDPSGEGTLPAKLSRVLELRDPSFMQQLRLEAEGLSSAERNSLYSQKALLLWRTEPMKITVFGIAKILHGFGFSLRGFRDYITAAFTLITFACSILVWRMKKYRIWCVFFWLSAAVIVVQMFGFLPNQRFKTVVFDLPGMLMIVLMSESFMNRFKKNLFERSTRRIFSSRQ